jgi:hypothetical protein
MSTAIMGNPQLYADDQIVWGKCTSVATPITKGDWVQFSGGFIVGLNKDATPAYVLSGVGVALDNHPVYDPLGRSMENTAMPVLTHGILRVTGGSAASFSGAPTLGNSVYPATTASGIVGTTGATGIGALWFTAAKQSISGNPTGAIASGVGKLINIAKAGDITATQWDVLFDARMLGVNYY